jgi:hypothetical protein
MSIEAFSWALNCEDVKSPTLKLVLIALANHSRPDGTAAFPSVSTMMRYTCLSERAIRQSLKTLEEMQLISRCNQEIVAAYIKRADRRPIGYDLNLKRGATDAPCKNDGVQDIPLRGAADAPKPYLNHTNTITTNDDFLTIEQRECYDWAKNHDYWHFAAVSVEKFLTIYSKPKRDGLKAQFDEHKKAQHLGGAARLDCEISKVEKSTRANYATHSTNNKKLTAAQRAKQLGERANACIDRNNVIDSTATHL